MNYIKIIIFAFTFFLLGMGFYLLSNNLPQQKPQLETVYTDSVPNPDRPVFTTREDTVERDSVPNRVGEELAPGTALIKATVVSIDFNREKSMNLTVKTEEVLGYGSATPPIASQQKLEVGVERYLKDNPADEKLLQKGRTVFIVISSREGMNFGNSEDKKRWLLVELKSQ